MDTSDGAPATLGDGLGVTPKVVIGPHGPSRRTTWLDRALRIVAAGPRPFFRAAIGSLALTSVLAMAVAAVTRPPGPLPGVQQHMITYALAALCLSAALGLLSLALSLAGVRSGPAWLDRAVGPQARAALWLALAAWFPFLLIVVYYWARATFPPPAHYLYSPYDDKRFITAAYLLGVLAPVIWVTMAARILSVGRGQPPTWRAWFTGLVPRTAAVDFGSRADSRAVGGTADGADPRPSSARRILRVAAGIATALGLAWYFAGPPWYLSGTSTAIQRQEGVWLIGLQAIAHGHLPYVGVANVPYGPGAQLVSYLLMHHVTSFSVVGFRQAWALQVWAGTSVLFVVFFLAFGYARGLAVTLLSALVYGGLHEIAFQPNSSYDGYFAWASPLRYVGVIGLVLLLPAVVRRCPSWRGAAAAAGIGALWGLTSYLAQENLAGGAVGALTVGALLLFSGTASWRAVRAALLAVLAGFVLIWAPVLAYYAAHGQLSEFLGQYFLFPSTVAEGINDTPWRRPSPLTHMYYILPFLLAVLALLSVFQVRPLRIATDWSRERVLLVVTVLATALLYQGVLLRSDTSHMTGTLLMVPAMVIITGTAAPRLFAAQRRVTAAIVGAALVIASFALLPSRSFSWTSVRAWTEAPYLDRQQLAAAPAASAATTVAGSRVGPGLSSAAECCQGTAMSMPAFIKLMEQIHTIVGNRTAYVANVHGEYPGLVYFGADLNPAPISAYEVDGSNLTESGMTAYLADFRTTLPQIQALLTYDVKIPEARYFLQRYPHAQRITVHFAGLPYYILLR